MLFLSRVLRVVTGSFLKHNVYNQRSINTPRTNQYAFNVNRPFRSSDMTSHICTCHGIVQAGKQILNVLFSSILNKLKGYLRYIMPYCTYCIALSRGENNKYTRCIIRYIVQQHDGGMYSTVTSGGQILLFSC